MKPDIIHIAALEAKDARIKELEEALESVADAVCSQSSDKEALRAYYEEDSWNPEYKVDAFLTVADIRKVFKALDRKDHS